MKLAISLGAIVLAASLHASVASATVVAQGGADTFTFQFDDSGGGPDGTVSPPFVGDGTFTSPVDLTPGTYALTSLPGFTMSFAILGDVFTQDDIATPLSEVAVGITSFGSGERLVFTENGPDGDGGPYDGSLDLVNSSGAFLSFEPSFYGGNNLYEEESGEVDPFGNYLALSAAPEPSVWALMIAGLATVGGALRLGRLRRSPATA